MIAAILRAQWLSMKMSRGRVMGAVAGIIWYGIWLVMAVAGAFVLHDSSAAELRKYLPLAFLGICAYWQLMPVISASMGSSLDFRKLLVYPVPHHKLFLIEVLLRLTTAIEMVMVLAAGTVGLLLHPEVGGWRAVPRIAAFLPVFVIFNLLLASGTRSLLERLLARRKLREVLVLFMTLIWVVPRLLISTGVRPKSLGPYAAVADNLAFPWTAAAHGVLGVEWLALLLLAGWTVLAGIFGRAQFERNLRFDSAAAQATPLRENGVRWRAWVDRLYRLPSLVWRDPLGGLVEKELRSLARTPRFRSVFIMGFTFGLAVWFPLIATHGSFHTAQAPSWFLLVVSIYALTLLGQVSYWNCFGFDRSATAFYFAAPLAPATVLLAKNLAAMIFIYLEVSIVAGVTAVLRLSSGWGNVGETLAVMAICALYMLALGNLSSVYHPRGSAPERVSQGGGRGVQGLLFLFYPAALLPVGMAYGARYAFESELLFVLGLTAAAIGGGVFYWTAMQSAMRKMSTGREQILQELGQGDGPVAAE